MAVETITNGVSDLDPTKPAASDRRSEGDDHIRAIKQAIKLTFVAAPLAADASGKAGQIAYDADYVYICVATDTWKRAALATWP